MGTKVLLFIYYCKNKSKMEMNNTKLRFYQKKEDPSYEKTLKQNPYAIYNPK